MKSAIVFLTVIFSGLAYAAGPFIVSDPQPEATKFRMKLGSGEWVEGAPVNQGAKFDIGNISTGNYNGEMQAGGVDCELTDELSGVISQCSYSWSESAKFKLKKNPVLSAPTSLKIKSE